jgi:hypothetical protein
MIVRMMHKYEGAVLSAVNTIANCVARVKEHVKGATIITIITKKSECALSEMAKLMCY